MNSIRVVFLRILGIFGKDRLADDLDEEMRLHLEMLVEDNIRKGMNVGDARRAANRSFGGLTQTREAYLDQRGLPIVETILQDLRYGFRMLRKNPGFTAVAVLTLALGIGANSAIFSVLDAVMLQALPVRNPGELIVLNWTSNSWPAVVEDLEGSNRKDPDSIRMALGAKPAGVFRMVLGEGLTLTTAGVVIGLAAAAFGTRLISNALYEHPRATEP